MPKLKDLQICCTGPSAESLKFSAALNVSDAGVFSAAIPDQPSELKEIALRMRHEGAVEVKESQGRTRVTARSLHDIESFLNQLARAFLECEVTIEDVIVYSYQHDVAYFVAGDGQLHPNGRYSESAGSTNMAGNNEGGVHEWRGKLGGSSKAVDHFSIRFFARCVKKTTFRRPSGSKVVYSELPLPETSFGGRLNSFIGLNRPGDEHCRFEERKLNEVPFSDDAARFFYETMIGICRLADRMDQFFGRPERVASAIRDHRRPIALANGDSSER